MSEAIPPSGEILIYQTKEQLTRVEVWMLHETVWLTQKQMAELFQKDVRTINEYIQNVLEEEELSEDSVIRKFRIATFRWRHEAG